LAAFYLALARVVTEIGVVFRVCFIQLLLLLVLSPRAFGAPSFTSAVTNGQVNIAGLVEASGVAASRNNPGVLWTENDSGSPAVVYAIDTQGRLLGTYSLPGNIDNEDLGMGPGPVPNVSYLYVADIGDNSANRSSIALYQIPEPAVYAWQTNAPVVGRALKGTRTITLTYPDGARNAEAEFVDPVTGDWFVFTKAATSRVYTAPKALLDTTNHITLTFVRTLPFNVPSGADISPLGNEILVRQEDFAALWTRTNGQSISSAIAAPSNAVPVTGIAGGEPNGEAIGFDDYGGGYFTLSDSASTQPLRYFARTSFDGPTPPRRLVPPGATWKYLDNGADAGTAWRTPGFTDAAWSSGAAQIGYGDGDEQTTAQFGPDPNDKFITTYFRRTFSATNVSRIASLTCKLVVADGAIVYLNGTMVATVNLSPGATSTTLATAMPTALRDTWQTHAIDPKWLVEGTNTIAVEVHLASATSASLSFDLQLLATEAPAITAVAHYGTYTEISLAGSSNSPTVLQGTTDFLSWTTLGLRLLTNGVGTFLDPGPTNRAARFYRAYRTVP
jgi:hypothetical protein